MGIQKNKIGVQGSSADGHLATLAGTRTDDVSAINDALDTVRFRPDFMILVSPVIDMDEFAHKGSRRSLLSENPS